MNKRTILVYALAGLFLLGCLYYFFREETAAPEASRPQTTSKREMSFETTNLVEEKDGKRLWELSAEAANVDETAKKIYLTNVKGTFYRDDGSSVTMIANKGVADTVSKEVILEGEVSAASASDGATFTAPQVRWAGEIRWFFADGGVKLVKQGTVITGDQFESDVDMEKIKVRGNAKVVSGGGGL
jgi:LPS export ABC transporter protein LptC